MKIIKLAAAALLLGSSLIAADIAVSAPRSKVQFTLEHTVLGTVNGNFGTFKGTLTTGNSGRVTALVGTVDTASINTDNSKRDDHLRNADFFDAPKNPQIAFQSTEADATSVTGNLTIHGVTKPVKLTYTKLDTQEYIFKGAINRIDFGVGEPKSLTNMVGNEVAITVTIR
ncbi:hypothetical protein AGMMS50229_06190 [Campylobacterota bacterium]|nr:hypothetical protein AGMMS50229_06190 [Campylobacterota bacterium]